MQTVTPVAGVLTIDQSRDNVFLVNMNQNVTSVAFTNGNAKAGQYLELHFVQDTTGTRTLTGWPATVKLQSGAVTLTTTASKRDVLALRQVANAADTGGVKYAEVQRSLNVAG